MPAPGQYSNENYKAFGSDCKSFKIRDKGREERKDFSPGPGHYNANDSIVKDKSVAFKMHGGERNTSPIKDQKGNN